MTNQEQCEQCVRYQLDCDGIEHYEQKKDSSGRLCQMCKNRVSDNLSPEQIEYYFSL